MGRNIRTQLPSLKQQFKTNNTDHERTQMQQNQEQHRKYHGGYDLKPLQPRDDVFMRNQADTHWTPAKVIGRTPEPRAYIVLQGTVLYRRNRRQILKPKNRSFKHPLSVTETDPYDRDTNYDDNDVVRHSCKSPKPTPSLVTSSAHSNTADTQTNSLNKTDQNSRKTRGGRRITTPKRQNL